MRLAGGAEGVQYCKSLEAMIGFPYLYIYIYTMVSLEVCGSLVGMGGSCMESILREIYSLDFIRC